MKKMVLIGLIITALALSLALGSALAQTKVRVGKAVAKTFGFIPVDVGIDQGFFKKRGLDVEVFTFRGAGPMWSAMAAGSIDISVGDSGGPLAIAKGTPIKILVDTRNNLNPFVLIIREGSGIKTLADLKGRKIGVTSHGAFTDWVIKGLSAKMGWDPDTGITRVPLGPFTGQLAAISRGETDGFVWTIDGGWEVEAKKLGRVFISFGEVFPEMNFEVMSVREEFLKKNPDVVKAFVDSWFESVRFMKANKDYTVKIMTKVLELTPEIASRVYDYDMKNLPSEPSLKKGAFKILADSYVRDGLLPKAPDPAIFYDDRFLK